MNARVHPKLDLAFAVCDALVEVAQELTRLANAQFAKRPVKRGATLRPGRSTPMWTALAAAVLPLMAVRGDKVKLGRILGVPRSRVHEFLKSQSAMPDAERTLLLLLWLAHRRAGRSLG
ncbi:MAG: hypothetical protein ABIV50_13480 [Opitutus sp.]